MGSTIAVYFAALFALVENNISLFCINYNLYRLHLSPTFASTVTGVYIEVKRP